MTKKVKLTIAMPVFNEALTITETLGSIYQQYTSEVASKCDLEVKIYDNQSTDNTQQVVKQFLQHHKALKVSYILNKENIGPINNIKKIVETIKEGYLWLFGDDALYPSALLTIINYIHTAKTEYALINMNTDIYDQDLKQLQCHRIKYFDKADAISHDLNTFLHHTRETIFFLSANIFNAKFLKKILPSYKTLHPQTDIVLKLASRFPCLILSLILIKERRHNLKHFTYRDFQHTYSLNCAVVENNNPITLINFRLCSFKHIFLKAFWDIYSKQSKKELHDMLMTIKIFLRYHKLIKMAYCLPKPLYFFIIYLGIAYSRLKYKMLSLWH